MTHPPAVHQLLPSLLPGDAISNHALALQKALRAWGYRSEIYAAHRPPPYDRAAFDYRRYGGDARDVLIYHYSIGSPLTAFAKRRPCRLVVSYHNVTPPHLLRGHSPQFRAELAQGREELAGLRGAVGSTADSEYNCQELTDLGFANPQVLPILVDFNRLDAATTPAAQAIRQRFDDGTVTMLFVGRIVPNKRQQDLVTLLAYYQRLVEPKARLVLVGSSENALTYQFELEMLVETLGLTGVEFLGQISDDELAACYHSASVYVSMSEHEGFGVPLLEAMHCGVPVLAYAVAAVPYTLGDAGILVHQKRYDVLAELVELLAKDTPLRHQVVRRQRQRVSCFEPGRVQAQWQTFINHL